MPRPPGLDRAGPPGRTGARSEAADLPAAPCREASHPTRAPRGAQAGLQRSRDPEGGDHGGGGLARSLPTLHDPGAGLARRSLARRILARRSLAGDDPPWPSLAAQVGIHIIRIGRRNQCLWQLGDASYEVTPPSWIQLAEDVVQEQERWFPIEFGQKVQLGELEGQDGCPLLAAGGKRGQITTANAEDHVVAVRPDECRAVPHLLVGGFVEPPRQ